MKLCLWALAALSVLAAHAYDLTTLDNKVYKDIRLLEKHNGGIRVAHSTGTASVDYQNMKPAEARLFGYDPAKYSSVQSLGGSEPARPFSSAGSNSGITPTGQTQRPAAPKPAVKTAPSPAPERAYRPAAPPAISGAARGQCTATTKKGYRCSRMAQAGSSTCWQH